MTGVGGAGRGAPPPAWREGHRLLAERLAALPDLLRAQERATLAAAPPALGPPRPVQVTGVGSSAAHARFLVQLLAVEARLPARFVPLGALLDGVPARAPDDTLVLFSQGLSPNARRALGRARGFGARVVVTAVGERTHDTRRRASLDELRRAGVALAPMAGQDEDGTLLRVIGPMAGYLAALRLGEALAPAGTWPAARLALDVETLCARLGEVERTAGAALAGLDAAALEAPLALIAGATYAELCENLRAKVLEGMLLRAPPIWDPVGFAHGPFQQLHPRPATLLALARGGAPGEEALVSRLEAMLTPGRHRLVRLRATLAGPLAIFEHEALMNRLVLRYIEARGVDQVRWPGRGLDGPLYDLDAEAAEDLPVDGAGDDGAVRDDGAAVAPGPAPATAPGPAAAPRSRDLAALTWPEVEALLDGGARTAVIPLGAVEQHGPHLPFATDVLIADELARRFCAAVAGAVRLPTVALGCSVEHLDFPGTLSLRPATLAALLDDLLASVARHGFERAFVFSAHGGNAAPLEAALPALRAAHPRLHVIAGPALEQVGAALHAVAAAHGVGASAAGHHAGELETAIALALFPDAVRRALLSPGHVAPVDDPQRLFYPSLRPNAPSGVVGDPRPASAARGEAYLGAWAALLVAAYLAEKKRA